MHSKLEASLGYTRLTQKNKGRDSREMTQWVKCLLLRHEGLSSDPQNPHKKIGAAMCSRNLRAGKAKVRDPWG